MLIKKAPFGAFLLFTDFSFFPDGSLIDFLSALEAKPRASETLSIVVAWCMATDKLCADFSTVRGGCRRL